MKEVEPQEKPAKKKRRLAPVLFGLLFLVGFGILAYPTISNQWNTYRQNQLISIRSAWCMGGECDRCG